MNMYSFIHLFTCQNSYTRSYDTRIKTIVISYLCNNSKRIIKTKAIIRDIVIIICLKSLQYVKSAYIYGSAKTAVEAG
jgi:hypothetical protein